MLTDQLVSWFVMAARKIYSETSQSIIDGAIAVMAESGLRHLTTKRVSQHASVSTASIHYFFKTKERLIQESLAHVMDEMWAKLVAVSAQGETPLESIRNVMDAFFEDDKYGVDTVKIWPQLWHHAEASVRTGDLFRTYNNQVITLLEEHLRAAGMHHEDARLYAYRLNALHRGLWIELHVGGMMKKSDTDKIYDSMMRTIKSEIQGESS